jgi:CPA1 family monovalent cation:H+ antiporter
MLSFASASASTNTASSFIAELLIISAVALTCKFVRLPYTVALVAVGLLLGLSRSYFHLEVQLTPDLLFVVLLPALLFEAAIHLSFAVVRKNLIPILLLAVPGMLITAVVVGYTLHYVLGLALLPALIFGALISSTDPISVLAIFKQLKAPKDLAVIVEGESLLNDGAAVVLFNLLLLATVGHDITMASGLGMFLREALGGLAIGTSLGWLAWRIHESIDDNFIEVTLSTILAYGSYLTAQHFHASGVIAVIAAGLVYGNVAVQRGMSVNTRLMLVNTWEYLGFICNSMVFLLIGTQVDLTRLYTQAGPILLAFLVVLAARGLAMLVLSPLSKIPWRWQMIVFWSGLRGSIAMALAMALVIPEREQILLLTFGVVLLSVFVQGLTIKPLMGALGIGLLKAPLADYEVRLGELIANERALSVLDARKERYHIQEEVYLKVATPLRESIARLRKELQASYSGSDVLDEQLKDAHQLVQNAQQWGLREALTQGLISEEIFVKLKERIAPPESEIQEEELPPA